MKSPLLNKRASASVDTLPLDDVSVPSTSSRYQDSFEDERTGTTGHFNQRPPQRTLLGRVLLGLGMTTRRRRDGFEYKAAPVEDGFVPIGVHKRHSQPRRRRSLVLGFLKRTLIMLPLVVLLFFGVLHVLQVLIGGARLFWDGDAYDEYLPNWGKLGHVGQGLADYPTDATRDILPVSCHSHNDYWRRIPLFEAIHYGCTGVEADVWMYDDELYVGHSVASLTQNRTFRSLYVNPLVEMLDKMNPSTDFVNASGHGVFDENPEQTLVLLVDFKTNGRDTWPIVLRQLEPLREKGYLSHWDSEKVISRAITVVGTGNTPFDMVIGNTQYRDIFFDAPLDKLWEPPRNPIEPADEHNPMNGRDTAALAPGNDTSSGQGKVGTDFVTSADAYNATNSYYASTSFLAAVGLVWRGRLSPRQLEIIRGQIRGARSRGLKARYWDTPAWPIALRNHIWHVLMEEGADMLNADDLKAAATANWKFKTKHDWWR